VNHPEPVRHSRKAKHSRNSRRNDPTIV
jgi:hypothetical protein